MSLLSVAADAADAQRRKLRTMRHNILLPITRSFRVNDSKPGNDTQIPVFVYTYGNEFCFKKE
jgi:hypothetical protein